MILSCYWVLLEATGLDLSWWTGFVATSVHGPSESTTNEPYITDSFQVRKYGVHLQHRLHYGVFQLPAVSRRLCYDERMMDGTLMQELGFHYSIPDHNLHYGSTS